MVFKILSWDSFTFLNFAEGSKEFMFIYESHLLIFDALEIESEV